MIMNVVKEFIDIKTKEIVFECIRKIQIISVTQSFTETSQDCHANVDIKHKSQSDGIFYRVD